MVLTAIEFLGLAFFLGMIAGAVLEQLARPRTPRAVKTNARDLKTFSVPTIAEAPADDDRPSCSFCGSLMIRIKHQTRKGFKCTSCGQETTCS